jgi:hypothetical protein
LAKLRKPNAARFTRSMRLLAASMGAFVTWSYAEKLWLAKFEEFRRVT